MRLTIRILGQEVLHLTTEPDPPQPDGPVTDSRHSGSFELGFSTGNESAKDRS